MLIVNIFVRSVKFKPDTQIIAYLIYIIFILLSVVLSIISNSYIDLFVIFQATYLNLESLALSIHPIYTVPPCLSQTGEETALKGERLRGSTFHEG